MLLICISQIEDSELVRDLDVVACGYSLLDMRQVYLKLEPMLPDVSKKFRYSVNKKNYYELARLLLALAIINKALSVHKEFEVPSLEPGKVISFTRKGGSLKHEKMVDWSIKKFYEVTSKYEKV
ncbi:MAG TPA: hypothetical protein VF837_02930 [Patescibacteria group bacterium]